MIRTGLIGFGKWGKKLHNTLSKITDLQFELYDKYGNKIFETSDQSVGWDGSYKDKLLDPNVFIYILNITMANGEKILLKGNVTLIR